MHTVRGSVGFNNNIHIECVGCPQKRKVCFCSLPDSAEDILSVKRFKDDGALFIVYSGATLNRVNKLIILVLSRGVSFFQLWKLRCKKFVAFLSYGYFNFKRVHICEFNSSFLHRVERKKYSLEFPSFTRQFYYCASILTFQRFEQCSSRFSKPTVKFRN